MFFCKIREKEKALQRYHKSISVIQNKSDLKFKTIDNGCQKSKTEFQLRITQQIPDGIIQIMVSGCSFVFNNTQGFR